jgi:hypothetical protein
MDRWWTAADFGFDDVNTVIQAGSPSLNEIMLMDSFCPKPNRLL